jgi:quinolinate synthase
LKEETSLSEIDTQTMQKQIRIQELKRSLDAVILAHNYQWPAVQDIADFVGDSLELARQARKCEAKTIVFCGVDFMAETAAIVNPGRTVLLPEITARCPMADMIDIDSLREWKSAHPKAPVVCYINSSAAVKAESDICCTSANAVRIVQSLPEDEILMVPDQNLANYVASVTSKRVIAYPGLCPTHHRLTAQAVIEAREYHKDGVVLAHPECRKEVLDMADAVLSTAQMLRYVVQSPKELFLLGTESGIIHRMQKENPHKRFYAIGNALTCPNMKKTNLDSVIRAMEMSQHVMSVPPTIREQALRSIERMLDVG